MSPIISTVVSITCETAQYLEGLLKARVGNIEYNVENTASLIQELDTLQLTESELMVS